jgi:hypothetical protein
MLRKSIYSVIFFILILNLQAQESEEKTVQNIFKGSRFINGHSSNLAEAGELQMNIQHRFGDISDGIYQLFGLDLASMRLGFEYGIAKNLSIEIGRSSMFKTYDGSVKFRIAQQSSHFPLTVTTTVGGSIPTEKNYFPEIINKFLDKSSGNAQLHLAKTIGIIGLHVTPGYLYTGYFKDTEKNSYKNLDVITLGLGGSLQVSKKVSVNLEYLYHFNENIMAKKPLSLGVDLGVGGHLFQLQITNSQAMFHQALYTNTYGDWGNGILYFGFNLIRTFKIKYNEEFY